MLLARAPWQVQVMLSVVEYYRMRNLKDINHVVVKIMAELISHAECCQVTIMHGKVLPLTCCLSLLRVLYSMSFKTDNPLCKNIAICWISLFGMNHKLFRLGLAMKVQLLFPLRLHTNRMEKGWFVYT